MEKFQHIVATRFLCFESKLGKTVLEKDTLNAGIALMSNYLIPSLENQTEKNFKFVLLVHDKLNLKVWKPKLMKLSKKLNISVCRFSKFTDYVKRESEGLDYMIVSRIDYDDMVNKEAVIDIQKRLEFAKGVPAYIYGYIRGYAYVVGDPVPFKFYNNYHNQGHISIFQSVIYNVSEVECTLHPYQWNHTRPLETIKCREAYLAQNTWDNAFVWVRHPNTETGYNLPGYVKERVELSDKFKKEFIDKFGVDVWK